MPSLKSSLGNGEHVSLDDVCSLISVTFEFDELKQPIRVEVERQIFCARLNVSRQEFFAAGQLNLKPQMTIVINADEYDYEKYLNYEGKKYNIYRSYLRVDGHYELYCEEVTE